MRLTLLESEHHFFQTAERVSASVLLHAGLFWALVAATEGSRQIPTDEREARVFFLLPPDRVAAQSRQTEILQLGVLGSDLEDGKQLELPSAGRRFRASSFGARGTGHDAGARALVPFGPPARLIPDTVFSVLQVDDMVERYESSAAPVYPPDLLATGTEGLVQAMYVVDTSGLVDTTSIRVMVSNDPRFTASVMTALGGMRFRPARKAGQRVRQLVEQKFRFKIEPAAAPAKQVS